MPVTGLQPFPLVFRPHPNLFDDVENSLYRSEGFQDDPELLWRLTTDAVQLLNRYSPDLAAGFCSEINTVAFMPRQPGGAKSFSMRNFYIEHVA